MNRGGISFILAIVLVQMSHGIFSEGSGNSQSLANLYFRSRMASKDPAVTMACFADYIEESNQVSEAYSGSYKQCLMEAKSGREGVVKEMANDRINIRYTSISVCERWETCNNLKSTLAIFNCHAEIGANNTKAVYSISGNASEFASMMQEQYHIIDLKHEQCCKSAEHKYVKDTAVVYRVLQDCLEGRVAPTTAAPITTTAATFSPATPTSNPDPTTTTLITPYTTTTLNTTKTATPTTATPTTTTVTPTLQPTRTTLPTTTTTPTTTAIKPTTTTTPLTTTTPQPSTTTAQKRTTTSTTTTTPTTTAPTTITPTTTTTLAQLHQLKFPQILLPDLET